jgi:hypothetical protein
MDIEFWTTLIVVAKEQSVEAAHSLKVNCTYVDNWCWIFEGDIECLEDDGVKFKELAEGAVPCLGDMSRADLVDLCKGVFGIDVYNQSFKRTANSAAA